MSSLRALTVLIAGAFPAAALADDYRAELGLSFDRVLFDGDETPDGDTLAVEGLFYFAPVRTDGLPLAEAAFLDRSSYVGAGVARVEFGNEHADVLAAEIGYYLPDTMFFGSLGVVKSDIDDLDLGDDTLVYGSFGVAPIDGLLVTTAFDEDGWDPNATAKYVGKFGNGHFYAASLSVFDSDDDDVELGLDFDYYLDNTFSIGASLNDDSFTVRAEKFFTPSFAVGVRAGNSSDTGDFFGATVKWRF